MKTITILIPAYNEEAVIEKMYKKLNDVCGGLSQYAFEFLFVNDGSKDRTIDFIKEFKQKDSRVQYVDLSRNFGKETAMLAGFDYAKGDAVIIIDADLQQPPETFAEMIHWWEEGYDDVYAVRVEREGESWFKKSTSKVYYSILQKVAKVKVYPQAGDFRLLDKKCIRALRQLREHERYTKGMYGWIGFKKKEITYIAEARAAGETKWKLSALMNLALNGITSYSTVPLRIWSIIGFVISMFAFIYMAIEIIRTALFGTDVAGYPSLIAGILFLGGIQLISLGIIGEYLGRVFVETKERPVYFIQEYSEEDTEKKETDDPESKKSKNGKKEKDLKNDKNKRIV